MNKIKQHFYNTVLGYSRHERLDSSPHIEDVYFTEIDGFICVLETTTTGIDTLFVLFQGKWNLFTISDPVTIFTTLDNKLCVMEYNKGYFCGNSNYFVVQTAGEAQIVLSYEYYDWSYPLADGYVWYNGVPCIFYHDENTWEPDWDYMLSKAPQQPYERNELADMVDMLWEDSEDLPFN